MHSEPPSTDLTVACHVRPALVLEPIDAKIETLRACERDGAISSLLLRSWPGEVAMSEDSPHPEVLEQYERFAEWADRVGVSIQPPFQRRETTSVATDRSIERLVTPTIALACYRDGTLVGVFPHTDGTMTHTVSEAIAAFRTGECPEPLREHDAVAERTVPQPVGAADGGGLPARPRPALASGETRPACPDCGGTLTNVQGVLDCGSCEWIATDRSTRVVAEH